MPRSVLILNEPKKEKRILSNSTHKKERVIKVKIKYFKFELVRSIENPLLVEFFSNILKVKRLINIIKVSIKTYLFLHPSILRLSEFNILKTQLY
jgi:hypothetical protein